MKIKYKTKFNIGDKVVVKDMPQPGYYRLGEVYTIHVYVNQFGVTGLSSYTIQVDGYGMQKFMDDDRLESIKEFEKRMKQDGRSYDHYLRWLNEQNFTGVKE